jgi:hypothetical protein
LASSSAWRRQVGAGACSAGKPAATSISFVIANKHHEATFSFGFRTLAMRQGKAASSFLLALAITFKQLLRKLY